ncbi:MAG: AAA family ATPase, partial [Acidaminococcaceae bacterium]
NIGISPAALSMFIKGTYTGDNEQIAKSVEQILVLSERRLVAVKKPSFVGTTIAEDIITVATYAHTHCDIGIVYGDAGIGKTMAITQYAKDNPLVIFITADVTSTVKTILEDILEELGCKAVTSCRSMAKKLLVKELRDTNRMVIIDEAQHLKLPTLEAVRGILYDSCHCGVLLCGNENVYNKMLGKQKAPFAQLFSRVGISRGFVMPRYQIDKKDVEKVVCQDVQLSEACIGYFHDIANKQGGLRSAIKLFVMTWEIANKLGEEISLDMIKSAEDYLIRV